MDDSLEQPSALRYVETRTTTGEQTQNGISDERLAEFVGAGELWCGDPGMQTMARELTALRASHKRLVEALEFHDKLMRRLWKEVNFFNFALSAETIQMLNLSESMARATLAEAAKLEGK